MTMQCKQVDIGDKCVECLRSTSFGTGLYVNRLPADNDNYIGWLCSECNWYPCDRCGQKIYLDSDYIVEWWEAESYLYDDFDSPYMEITK